MLIDLGLCTSLHAVVCTTSVCNSTRVFISLCAAAFLPCSVIMFESPGKFHIKGFRVSFSSFKGPRRLGATTAEPVIEEDPATTAINKQMTIVFPHHKACRFPVPSFVDSEYIKLRVSTQAR